MLSFKSFVMRTLNELHEKETVSNLDDFVTVEFSQFDINVGSSHSNHDDPSKYHSNGLWFRRRDDRQCCHNVGCCNIVETSKICRICSGIKSSNNCWYPKCTFQHCVNLSRYGYLKDQIKLYCFDHKSPDMISLSGGNCKFEGCMKRKSFGYPEDMRSLFCTSHKLDGMIDVINNICIFPKCKIRSSFNYPDFKTAIHCSAHKLDGMILIDKGRQCQHEGCKTISVYNYKGETKGIFCKKHRLDGMINVKTRICKYSGCTTQPVFNYPDIKTPFYCSHHKLDGMIDVVNLNKMNCKFEGCKIVRACYNYPDEKKGIFCSSHRKDGMVNVADKRCIQMGCNVLATFNYAGEKSGLYCIQHKLDDMLNVKNKMCEHSGCKTIATSGFPGKGKIYCASHKQKGMIFRPNINCKVKSCKKLALYGIFKPEHCEAHKEACEINFVEKECISCGLSNILGLDKKCEFCNPENARRAHLAKQKMVEDFLRVNNYVFTTDQTIDRGECGKERPDFLFLAGSHAIIIEVDENQHSGRPCECEQTRMINIWQALAMPVWYIRYNPDEYKKPLGRKKCEHESKAKRLAKLKEWLDYTMMYSPIQFGNMVNVVYLYFDNYQDSDTFQCLQKMELVGTI